MGFVEWMRRMLGVRPLAGRRVIVVGAGAAGLAATRALVRQGAEVVLLEATERVGGRVRTLRGFADFPLELGAEEVHGTDSLWWELARGAGAQALDADTEDYFFVDGELLCEDEALANDAIAAAWAFFETLDEWQGDDVPIALRMIEEGLDERGWRPLEAWLGGDYGATSEMLGARSVAISEQAWPTGGDDVVVRGSMEDALVGAFADEAALARTGEPVTAIRWDGDGVRVTTRAGTHAADAVVITVPLPILRRGDIEIDLPEARREALAAIGAGACTKAALRFREAFWPDDAGSIYGASRVAEYWCPTTGRGTTPVLMAFATGRDAAALGAADDPVAMLLADLDGVFGEGVASGAFVGAVLSDWENEPYSRGAFSYAAPGSAEARQVLAAPLDGRVFFAGEATHTEGHFATVHGAIETGMRAAAEVEAALRG